MRRKLFVGAQWLFAAAVVWYAARALSGQWDASAARLTSLDVQWSRVVVATLIVLATYALLIETWRKVVTASNQNLSFRDAARIWFVSNLGKYIPGKVWSIGAMTVMAQQQGVAGMVAAGSSIVVQLVTIAAGIAVVLVAGTQLIERPLLAAMLGIATTVALLCLPLVAAQLTRMMSSMTGRQVSGLTITARTITGATLHSIVAWIAYGVAFQLFVKAVLGTASGATLSYTAVYAASYIIGVIALFAPGGVVVRESAMVAGMLQLGLAGEADALAVAIASRIWLTITELLPGLVYLALGKSTVSDTKTDAP